MHAYMPRAWGWGLLFGDLHCKASQAQMHHSKNHGHVLSKELGLIYQKQECVFTQYPCSRNPARIQILAKDGGFKSFQHPGEAGQDQLKTR